MSTDAELTGTNDVESVTPIELDDHELDRVVGGVTVAPIMRRDTLLAQLLRHKKV